MRGAQVERARYDWDRKGYRQAVTIALAQIRFRDQLDPELVWNQLERNFLEFGGAAYRRFGLRPPIKTDPPLPLKDGSPIRWQMASMTLADGGGATVQIPYIMVRILREWFDPIMLWRLRWGWDRAAPLGSAFRFSNGRSCSTDSALPCVVEWLIVVREDASPACTNSNGLSGVSHVIGLSGEVLPQLPWFIETGRIFISGEEQIGRAYSIDYVRQRLAVRSF